MREQRSEIRSLAAALFASAAAFAVASACSGGLGAGARSNDLSVAMIEASSSGTLLCAPTQAQLDACAGKASGGSCTPAGGATNGGTCRSTVEGTGIACVRNPPAPPQALVDACTGKASGDICSANSPHGDAHVGLCGAPSGDPSTLICLHVRTPPQAAVDACTGKQPGDGCALPGHERDGDDHDGDRDDDDLDGGAEESRAGTCRNLPAATGPLACTPAHNLEAEAAAACTGLAAGAGCTLGHHDDSAAGACTVPAGGSAPLCVVACGSLEEHGGGEGRDRHR